MHIEKNIYDNLIRTLLNLDRKSKDNLKAHLDMKEMKEKPSFSCVVSSRFYQIWGGIN